MKPITLEIEKHPTEVSWTVRANGKAIATAMMQVIAERYVEMIRVVCEMAGVEVTVKK